MNVNCTTESEIVQLDEKCEVWRCAFWIKTSLSDQPESNTEQSCGVTKYWPCSHTASGIANAVSVPLWSGSSNFFALLLVCWLLYLFVLVFFLLHTNQLQSRWVESSLFSLSLASRIGESAGCVFTHCLLMSMHLPCLRALTCPQRWVRRGRGDVKLLDCFQEVFILHVWSSQYCTPATWTLGLKKTEVVLPLCSLHVFIFNTSHLQHICG